MVLFPLLAKIALAMGGRRSRLAVDASSFLGLVTFLFQGGGEVYVFAALWLPPGLPASHGEEHWHQGLGMMGRQHLPVSNPCPSQADAPPIFGVATAAA